MKYAVVCVGNPRLSDDGFGRSVETYLRQRYDFGGEVAVVGIDALNADAVEALVHCEGAALVAAVDGTASAPGTSFEFDLDAADLFPGYRSAGELSFADLFACVLPAQTLRSCRTFCVQVGELMTRGGGSWLSAALEASVAPVARAVAAYLRDAYHIPVKDLWAADDPMRAGSTGAGARSFSTEYGQYGNQAMAIELADRLFAAGFDGVAREGACVSWRQEPTDALAAFGVTFGAGRALACVRADITDYDVDALLAAAGA